MDLEFCRIKAKDVPIDQVNNFYDCSYGYSGGMFKLLRHCMDNADDLGEIAYASFGGQVIGWIISYETFVQVFVDYRYRGHELGLALFDFLDIKHNTIHASLKDSFSFWSKLRHKGYNTRPFSEYSGPLYPDLKKELDLLAKA